jgi:hypothetical protein
LAALCQRLEDGLVFLIDEHRPIAAGHFAALAAFAIQPSVGAVWPFRRSDLKLSYTRHPYGDRLTQVAQPPNPYSRFSGNILTGPLHCMLTRTENLRLAIDVLSNLGDVSFDFLDRSADLDAVGASLGLALLTLRRRNVSCRGMFCDVSLGDVFPPRSMVPQRDPYV